MSTYNITNADLQTSAKTYAKELLVAPMIGAKATLQHLTGIPRVRYRHTFGQLDGDIELGPYNASREDNEGLNITGRTLETYLGSCIKNFDPNEVVKSIYGSLQTQGEALTTTNIARATLHYLSLKLGKKLNMAIFRAKRNDGGSTTMELFDGFDTITEREVTATNLSTEKNNYVKLPALTATNTFDEINKFYLGSADELQLVHTKLYMPKEVYDNYLAGALVSLGSVVYNTGYEKRTLTVSDGLCELVPLASKKGSKYLHLSIQENMVYGYGDGLAEEKIEIERFKAFVLSFIATMMFGVQMRSLSAEFLKVGELTL